MHLIKYVNLDKLADKSTNKYDPQIYSQIKWYMGGTWGVHGITPKLDKMIYVDLNHFYLA